MSRSTARLVVPLLATLLTLSLSDRLGRAAPAPNGPAKEKDSENVVPNVEVRFTDGSTLKVKVLDAQVPLKTPYGKLVIPIARIKEMDCATRVSDAIAKRIKAAIAKLSSEESKERDAGTAELLRIHVKAYPALLEVEKSDELEVRRRVKTLLEKIRQSVSEEDLQVRPHDIVHTDDSKMAGKIESDSFQVETVQFGEVRLKLSNVRSIRSLSAAPRELAVDALPDPGTLGAYQGQVGKVLHFKVTGSATGSTWGTGTYTLDSNLATASVHAGALRAGQNGIVKVKIVGPVAGFTGSPRNGVQSGTYGPWAGYEVIVK